MLKAFFFCRRRIDITHDRYVTLLLDGHVPIALRHHPTMRRYCVQIVDESLADAPALDSIGILWFDSLEDFRDRLYDSPQGERIVVRDVSGFMGGADAYSSTEKIHRTRSAPTPPGTRTPGVKLVAGLTRSAALTRDEFVRHWREQHVPLVLDDPRVKSYATNLVDGALHGSPPQLDGIAELWFDSLEDFRGHAAATAAWRADLPRFVERVTPYRVQEFVQR